MRAFLDRNPARGLASTAVLYTAFALTGFATALLGATLPAMLAHWSLADRGAGLLFLLLFLGSSIGALLSRGDAAHSTARGAALLCPVCAALAFASGRFVIPLAFAYGLGLGIAITSINLLRSQRCAGSRVREMNRLNLAWPLGAVACPWLANEILRRHGVQALFLLLAAAFAAFTLWMLLAETGVAVFASDAEIPSRARLPRLPFVIGLTTLLATGLESSTGSWIATYAGRLDDNFEAPVAVASVFWFGLLASRALYSTGIVQQVTEQSLLRIAASIAGIGCVLMLASHGQLLLSFAGFLIGFGVGPVYPLLLAATLPRISGNTIFVMAGMGGAIFPYVTGSLSTHAASLRVGLLVPAAAGLAIVVCAWLVKGNPESVNRRG